MQKNSHLISLFSQNFTDLFFFEWAKAAEVHFHMLNAQNTWMPQDSFTDVMITPSVLKYTIEDTLKFIDMEEKLGGKIL